MCRSRSRSNAYMDVKRYRMTKVSTDYLSLWFKCGNVRHVGGITARPFRPPSVGWPSVTTKGGEAPDVDPGVHRSVAVLETADVHRRSVLRDQRGRRLRHLRHGLLRGGC